MDARLRNAVVRWVLLGSVALGIVVMHHVIAADDPIVHAGATSTIPAPPMGEHPAPEPGPDHDVLHRCMAVIQHGATTVIVLMLLIGAAVLTARRGGYAVAPIRMLTRPPPRLAGRALLHAVCIARV